MLAFSSFQYSRYALTLDFGGYTQAWWAIGHGHLSPQSTLFGTAFWRNNADFLMWPIAYLSRLFPHPIVLLWLQDLVVVATEAVALRWAVDAISRSRHPGAARIGGPLTVGVASALFINPWVWETIAFDFHFENFAALFAVLVGWDLWAGRTRRLWWWVPLALLAEALGGIYLVGVGLAGVLAGRRTRVPGVLIAGAGLAWIVVLTAVGGDGQGGHGVAAWYGYLVGPHSGHIGVTDIVIGIVRHPGLAATQLGHGLPLALVFLVTVGLIGVWSPWGFGMALAVLLPNMLNASPSFFRVEQSFQTWPALPFVLFGSVLVILRLIGSDRGRLAGMVVAQCAAIALVLAAVYLPRVPPTWLSVDARAASALSEAQSLVPNSAELVASQGVIGRLSARPSVYAFGASHLTIPVDRPRVYFVLTPGEGVTEVLPPGGTRRTISFIEQHLKARLLEARSNVFVLDWTPPRGTTQVTLP